ncbi:hypothetical protein [Cytobacillus gottheilii]|uniref:hypothetical protein n=1 Tax=Cytobacillus gottheilii TaxID=859144 RepID=UPI0009BB8F79|nr:hypothetical protein [Cytobacillus gottheilii]
MANLLIKYISREDNHVDPNFTYLTYGDSGTRGSQIINSVLPSSYVFFHTSFNGKGYITAYFYVERILTRGENGAEIASLVTDSKVDDVVILGSRERSKILTYPLPFERGLAVELTSLGIDSTRFDSGQSELQTISNATRTHRELSAVDVELLLNKCLNLG